MTWSVLDYKHPTIRVKNEVSGEVAPFQVGASEVAARAVAALAGEEGGGVGLCRSAPARAFRT